MCARASIALVLKLDLTTACQKVHSLPSDAILRGDTQRAHTFTLTQTLILNPNPLK